MDVIEELKSFWENSHKKNFRGGVGLGGGGGVRVDVNKELKFLCKFKKNIYFFFLGGGGGGFRLGGQGGCESRIEVFWKIQKK